MSLGTCVLGHNKTIELIDIKEDRGYALLKEVRDGKVRKITSDVKQTRQGWEIVYARTKTTMYLYERYFKTKNLYDKFYEEVVTLKDSDCFIMTYNHGFKDHYVIVYKDINKGLIKFVSVLTKEELFSVRVDANVMKQTYLIRIENSIREHGFKIFHLTSVSDKVEKKLALRNIIGEVILNKENYFAIHLKYNDFNGVLLLTKNFVNFVKVKVTPQNGVIYFQYKDIMYKVDDFIYNTYNLLSFKEPMLMSYNQKNQPTGYIMGLEEDRINNKIYVHIHNDEKGKKPFKHGFKNQKFRRLQLKKDTKGSYVAIDGSKVNIQVTL